MLHIGIAGSLHESTEIRRTLQNIDNISLYGCIDLTEETGCKNIKITQSTYEFLNLCKLLIFPGNADKHFSLLIRAIKNGINIFLCQPASLQHDKLTYLAKLAEEAGTIFHLSNPERSNPAVLKGFQSIKRPWFIEICHHFRVSSTNSFHSCSLAYLAKVLELILMLPGTEIRKVHPAGRSLFEGKSGLLNLRIELTNGCVINYTSNTFGNEELSKTRIFEDDFIIEIDHLQQTSTSISITNPGLKQNDSLNCHENLAETEIKLFIQNLISERIKNPLQPKYLKTLLLTKNIEEKLKTAALML